MPVWVVTDCGDAAVWAGLALIRLVELGSCILAVVVWVRLVVVLSVVMAEVDSGLSCGVVVASVVGSDVVV